MLQPDRETRAEWTKTVTAFVEKFIEGLETAPASSPGTAVLPHPRRRPRASYLAYFPAGGPYSPVLAEFVAQATNRYTGVASTAPALVALEHSVIRWLCDEFGLPAGSGGIFTTGAHGTKLARRVLAGFGRAVGPARKGVTSMIVDVA